MSFEAELSELGDLADKIKQRCTTVFQWRAKDAVTDEFNIATGLLDHCNTWAEIMAHVDAFHARAMADRQDHPARYTECVTMGDIWRQYSNLFQDRWRSVRDQILEIAGFPE